MRNNGSVRQTTGPLIFFAAAVVLAMVPAALANTNVTAELQKWLSGNMDQRSALSADVAEADLSRAEAAKAAKLLSTDAIAQLRKERAAEWEAKDIRIGDHAMMFEYRTFGPEPEEGRSLYISMHGGGGTTSQANNQQWFNQINLYKTPPGSLYVAPRAPTDKWDLWHKAHIDDFFERMIEDAMAFYNVNPNRVYILGYSAGGDGAYQLAPRMADRWAAAAMMAGHPGDASPLGLRNIGFSLWCGAKDSAYKRNQIAAEWGQKLADLKKADPEGYRHEVHIQKGMGHWMNGTDAAAIKWMDKFTRDPFPKKVAWHQDNRTHDRFYWLGVPEGTAQRGAEVIAERNGQVITISKADKLDSLMIYLNDEICDMDKPVKVVWNGKTLFEGKVARTVKAIQQSLAQRIDPASIFYGQIQVDLKKNS